jgi:hypothetical protein
MKRWTLRTLLCLLLGAVTTVAVAWGCVGLQRYDEAALSFREHRVAPRPDDLRRAGKSRASKPRPGDSRFSQEWTTVGSTLFLDGTYEAYLYRMGSKELPQTSAPMPSLIAPPALMEVVETCGWPMRCLYWERRQDRAMGLVLIGRWRLGNGTRVLRGPNGTTVGLDDCDRVIPLRPLSHGFVIDTLFYAVIWGGVFFGFASAKRAIRRNCGRCPRCGYDLRGHRHEGTEPRRHEGQEAGCPECGWNREGIEATRHQGTERATV